MMPGPDGFEVCQSLKGDPRYSGIPILLLSAGDRARNRERGLAVGAEDYLTKPYSPSDLVSRIRDILDEHGRQVP
jgi:two-component system cell cycle response regulator